jgi:hypothetical protein
MIGELMSSSNLRPKWWQVYLTLPVLITLFIMDSRLRISARGHQAVQIGIVVLIYGLIRLWIKANASAFLKMDQGQVHGRIVVIQPPGSQLPGADVRRRSLFELSASEIKGVLSDTFEMDYMDAETSRSVKFHEN